MRFHVLGDSCVKIKSVARSVVKSGSSAIFAGNIESEFALSVDTLFRGMEHGAVSRRSGSSTEPSLWEEARKISPERDPKDDTPAGDNPLRHPHGIQRRLSMDHGKSFQIARVLMGS